MKCTQMRARVEKVDVLGWNTSLAVWLGLGERTNLIVHAHIGHVPGIPLQHALSTYPPIQFSDHVIIGWYIEKACGGIKRGEGRNPPPLPTQNRNTTKRALIPDPPPWMK